MPLIRVRSVAALYTLMILLALLGEGWIDHSSRAAEPEEASVYWEKPTGELGGTMVADPVLIQ
ncbi:MAG: hypothetical protein OEM27_04795, partial [Nitrospinota bacterium]|nr:hypothetical protein [Nitrospinota bacterium]